MNPKAGHAKKEQSSLTPWDSIDPNEPADVGVLCAPVEWEDEPEVAVYRFEESEREPAKIQAEDRVVVAITRSFERSEERADAHALSSEATEYVPEKIAAPHAIIETDAALAEAPADPARIEVASDNSADILATAARDLAVFDPDQSLTFNGESDLYFTATLPNEPAVQSSSPELFVDVPDALDNLPDGLAPIADIADVVGAASISEVSKVQESLPATQVIASETAPSHASPIDLKPIVFADQSNDGIESTAARIELAPAQRPAQVAARLQREEAAEEIFAQAIDDADVPEDGGSQVEAEPEPVWEDPEMEQEPAPLLTGATWTIPLLCAGIGLIACCVVIPQADANRRLAYEKQVLQTDLESVEKQVAVNDEFLKKVVDDPSLAERLAQRQLKRVRKGQHVLQMKDEKLEMSPFQIVNVAHPEPLPPYKPVGGVIASLCYDARTRLYTLGAAMGMIACGLIMGASPIRQTQ